jgi:hypothetical protein
MIPVPVVVVLVLVMELMEVYDTFQTNTEHKIPNSNIPKFPT